MRQASQVIGPVLDGVHELLDLNGAHLVAPVGFDENDFDDNGDATDPAPNRHTTDDAPGGAHCKHTEKNDTTLLAEDGHIWEEPHFRRWGHQSGHNHFNDLANNHGRILVAALGLVDASRAVQDFKPNAVRPWFTQARDTRSYLYALHDHCDTDVPPDDPADKLLSFRDAALQEPDAGRRSQRRWRPKLPYEIVRHPTLLTGDPEARASQSPSVWPDSCPLVVQSCPISVVLEARTPIENDGFPRERWQNRSKLVRV